MQAFFESVCYMGVSFFAQFASPPAVGFHR